MNTIAEYIKTRKAEDPEFAKDFDDGYEKFKARTNEECMEFALKVTVYDHIRHHCKSCNYHQNSDMDNFCVDMVSCKIPQIKANIIDCIKNEFKAMKGNK